MTTETQDIVPKEPATLQIESIVPKEGVPRFYANNVSVGQTAFDLRIIFSEVTDVTKEKITVEQRVQVTMSWPEAKLVADFVGKAVKAFEERNGTIVIGQVSEIL